MKIGLIDVDGHNFPNLALMKLSSYHKKNGDQVEWYNPFTHYHLVYKSKVFSFTPDYGYAINADKVVGGVQATPYMEQEGNTTSRRKTHLSPTR